MSSEAEHIFEKLRHGVVPDRGLETFAVGIERARGEMHRQLKLVSSGEGACKFLRGSYGCGKTFMSRLTQLDAQAQNFATSFVVVSDNDFHLHKFDVLYQKVMDSLSTAYCDKAALSDIIDRWVAKVEDGLIAGGADEDSDEFDELVRKRLSDDLHSASDGAVPQDMIRVIQAVFEAKQEGELAEAGALLSWLSGSGNVAAPARKRAQVKGEIGSSEALNYLRGIVEIVKAAGYAGMVVVVDEMETILRMRRDVRQRSMNGLRQLLDASGKFPGLLWVFTGTAEFFDVPRGVAGLAPLHDRVRFQQSGGFANPRQPQLELKPFDKDRLKEVALKLREIYPAQNPAWVHSKVSPELIEGLAAQVTEGFKGDVGVIPRHFLRSFVNILDLVDTEENYNPAQAEGITINPTDDERKLIEGQPLYEEEPEDAKGYELVEF